MGQDDRIADLEAKVAELTALLQARTEPAEDPGEPGEVKSSRRGMIKLAGAVAAGAVASTVVGQQAAATVDEDLVTGHINSSQYQTVIRWGGAVNGGGAGNRGPTLDNGAPMLLIDAVTGAPSDTSQGISVTANGTALTASGDIGIIAVGGEQPALWGLGGNYSLNSGPTSKANLYLQPNNNFLGSNPKTPVLQRTDAHLVGELENVAGELWACVASGTPGTWRKLTGPTAAGSLHLLAAPKRVYDSRPTEEPLAVAPKIPLPAGGPARTIDTTANGSGVPAQATGVLLNVGVVTASGAGFLSVTPGGAGFTGTSSLNWNGSGIAIANGVTVGCGAGATIDLYAGAGATNVFVDVFGYYI